MPSTALRHFREDLARAMDVVAHANSLPRRTVAEQSLQSDVLRGAWMFVVGALDAYFCDAYTDVIAVTVSSNSRQASIVLPEFFYEVRFPVRAILEEYANPNWRWRMAARKMMERENVLSLATIQSLFNKFFREDRRFFHGLLDAWMSHPDAKNRLFGMAPGAYRALTPADKDRARQRAMEQLKDRFRVIFQRRHDCIHNCDRPRMSPQPLKGQTVLRVIQDVEFLVHRCNEHIDAEFRQFLIGIGCSTRTLARAGY